MIIFFEPQTGIYKDKDWESNYYHYRLDSRYNWSTMTADWLDQNIARAYVGTIGLVYSPEFMQNLAELEESTNALDEVAWKLDIHPPQKIL
jgi:hypothetical protein